MQKVTWKEDKKFKIKKVYQLDNYQKQKSSMNRMIQGSYHL